VHEQALPDGREASELVKCRGCARLTYTRSQVAPWIRKVRKVNKLRERIDWPQGEPHLVKPRGMHRRTFERIAAEHDAAGKTANESMVPKLERWENKRREGLALLAKTARGG
jgi:hypothetical protein